MDTFEALTTLRGPASLALKPDDIRAAQSLVSQYDRRQFLTPAQEQFVIALAGRALNGGTSPRMKTTIGGFAAISALFARAAARLKQPAIVIAGGGHGGASYRLRLAGPRSRVPGSIDVLSGNAPGGRYDWFGRILSTGEFEASPRTPSPVGLVPLLQSFAADPAGVAGAAGKLTGRCCFCQLPIGEGDDPRARAVGYGEVCAGHYGLPFPAKATAQIVNAAVLTGQASPGVLAAPPRPAMIGLPDGSNVPAPAPRRPGFQIGIPPRDPPPPSPAAASILNAGPPRPAGVCRACFAAGYGWDEPMFDGSCYQCGGAL